MCDIYLKDKLMFLNIILYDILNDIEQNNNIID